MINIEQEIKVTKIYLVENCYGDKNKVYIGKEKSHQIKSRKTNHKNTFGNQIEFNYIDECLGWEKEKWKPLESFYIRYFKFLGFEVLNENEGGNGVQFHTKETRLKMSKPKPQGFGEKLSLSKKGKSKPIGFGEKISQSLKGKKRSDKSRENISKATLGKKLSQKTKDKIGKAHKGKKYKGTKLVLQYDLQGKFIKEWESTMIVSIKLHLNQGNIISCCLGKLKSSGKFIWKYKQAG